MMNTVIITINRSGIRSNMGLTKKAPCLCQFECDTTIMIIPDMTGKTLIIEPLNNELTYQGWLGRCLYAK